MELKTESCPICGKTSAYLQKNDSGFDEWMCQFCHHAFVWPQPTEKYLKDYYDKSVNYVKGAAQEKIEPPKRAHRILISMAGKPQGALKVLDVGAGFGSLLLYWKENGHCAFAYEYSNRCAEFLQKHGMKCFQGEFGAKLFEGDAPFDLVFMCEVLEHVPDPIGYLGTARAVLRKGGKICLSVPNKDFLLMKSYNASFANNPHLSHFSQQSLALALGKAGFENVKFALASSDTYQNTGLVKSAAITGANIFAKVLHAASCGKINTGFQLFACAENP